MSRYINMLGLKRAKQNTHFIACSHVIITAISALTGELRVMGSLRQGNNIDNIVIIPSQVFKSHVAPQVVVMLWLLHVTVFVSEKNTCVQMRTWQNGISVKPSS